MTGTAAWLLWLNRSFIVSMALFDRDGRKLVDLPVIRHGRLVSGCIRPTAVVLCGVSRTAASGACTCACPVGLLEFGHHVACSSRPVDGSGSSDRRQCVLHLTKGQKSVVLRYIIHLTRLETRTKESNICASYWALRNPKAK